MQQPFGTDVNCLFDVNVLVTIVAAPIEQPGVSVDRVAHGLLTAFASPLSVLFTVTSALKSEEVLNEAAEICRRAHRHVPETTELRQRLQQILEALAQNSAFQHTLAQFAAVMGFIQEINPQMADEFARFYAEAAVLHRPVPGNTED